MDLTSRWDRYAVTVLLLAIGAMTGCQGLFGSGSGPSQSSVVVSSPSLDFGPVVVGSSKTLPDMVTNGTAATVTITSASVSDSQFRITAPPFPLVLSPGQTATLTVSFAPHAAGKPSGKLALMSTALRNGEMDLAVVGDALSAGKLSVTPGSVAFGSVRVGQSQAQSATLTNSGESSVTISQASASSAAFSLTGLTFPLTLAAGQSAPFSVVFTPKTAGSVSGNISVNGQASLSAEVAPSQHNAATAPTTAAVTVTGDGTTAGQLALTPSSVNFGTVAVGSNQSQAATITNSGGTSATISAATISGTGFSLSGLTLPLTVSAGQSVPLQVTFAPKTAGASTGSIAIASTASNSTLVAAVTGTSINPGSLSTTPSSLSFGSVAVGSSQSQTASISNSGGANLTVSQATATGTGFSIAGLALPVTLTPGQTAAFTVTFAPQNSGNLSGSVSFKSDVASASIALAGTGLAAGALGASPASVNFGNVQVGTNQSQTITLANNGGASVTISQASGSGAGFSLSGLSLPLTLQAGQATTFTATFAPATAGSAKGNIALANNGSAAALNIALAGSGVTAGALAANPASIDFGSVLVGNTQTHSEVLSNTGGLAVNVSNAALTGTGFSLSGVTAPFTLNPGQSLTFSIAFAPQSSASSSGSLSLTTDGSAPGLTIALAGTGTSPGQLSLTPATVAFGSVTVGTSQNQTGKVTASTSSVTISSVASSNPEFALSGLTLPITLTAGQSVSFTLSFTPQASGAASGNLTFTSNASNAPAIETITGTGVAAPQHSVGLSWTPSTSTVVGYNVYRGTQTSGPYAMIGSGAVSSTYTDGAVQAGQTYYYVVTAVDGSGNESVYSNQVQAVVPSP